MINVLSEKNIICILLTLELFYDCKNITLFYDDVLFFFHLYIRSCIFRINYFLSNAHFHLHIFCSRTYSNYFCFLWFFLCGASKNNEMWADSKEMIKMRIYLDSKVNLPEPEFAQLDKLLLEKAVKAVEDNLTEPDFDVTALADAMNMSRSTLTRKLKAITGRTPLDFIRNIKMKHARHMLEDKDKSVTEVAATLGYFNRKYFTTCFKEEFGMTPSEFQKSQHEE